jgi:hypothetical protein
MADPREVAAANRATPGAGRSSGNEFTSRPGSTTVDSPGGFDLFSAEGFQQNAIPLAMAAAATLATGGAAAPIILGLLGTRASGMMRERRDDFERGREFYSKLIEAGIAQGDPEAFERTLAIPEVMKGMKKYGISEEEVMAAQALTNTRAAALRRGLLQGVAGEAGGIGASSLSPTELEIVLNPERAGRTAQAQPYVDEQVRTESARGAERETASTANLARARASLSAAGASEASAGASRALADLRRAKITTERENQRVLREGDKELVKQRRSLVTDLVKKGVSVGDANRVIDAIADPSKVDALPPRLRDQALAFSQSEEGANYNDVARAQDDLKEAERLTNVAFENPDQALSRVNFANDRVLNALKTLVRSGRITPAEATERAQKLLRTIAHDSGMFSSSVEAVPMAVAEARELEGSVLIPIADLRMEIARAFGGEEGRARAASRSALTADELLSELPE